ncbi:MAG: glycosyl hydrolase [Bacteroidia bacterium]|nr:glycosyl hydrolase [Bacteroidia bacterium]
MSLYKNVNLAFGTAICYSGYRDGQSPGTETYPTYDQIKEDLLILQGRWKYLRLYDCSKHAELTLEVIHKEKLDFQLMLGAYINAEVSNPNCPWGANYSEEVLEQNRVNNIEEINKLISLANQYPDIALALSVGNEATVDWTDHLVPVERVIEYVRMVKKAAKQPVTFCENYVPWHGKLAPLVEEVDFISIHTYPVWEYKNIHEAMAYTKDNYWGVANKYPQKPVMITEAGWATNSNGRGIHPENVNEDIQEMYYHDLAKWTEEEGIICFLFEAFDESWKGSPDELEPEKHWGIFKVDRTPKKVMKPFYPHLVN